MQGDVLTIDVSLSVNLAAPTIEQVLAKRKKVVTDMCTHMSKSLEHEIDGPQWAAFASRMSGIDVREYARSQLQRTLTSYLSRDPEFYNDDQPLGEQPTRSSESSTSSSSPSPYVTWPLLS